MLNDYSDFTAFNTVVSTSNTKAKYSITTKNLYC